MRRVVDCFIAVSIAGLALAPTLWMVTLSFKTRMDALAVPPKVVFTPTLDNYKALAVDRGAYGAIANSLVISSSTSLLSLALGAPAGFWLSRRVGRLRDNTLFNIIVARVIPPAGIMLSIFIWMRAVGLIGTVLGLIIVHTCFGVLFTSWMMKGFFDQLPKTIEEAALIDGDTPTSAFLRIVLPLSVPGLLLTGFFSFMASWNEFAFALVLSSQESRPVVVLIPGLLTPQGTYWGQVAGLGTIATLPVLLAAAVARKHLVRGLVYGSLRSV